ncbi:hypothetical protein [Limnoglobus roseus]|uniref:Uncharacterized protein n=1 Tax=Limnoglobus roseus TaxID=2598579 RepID=A0A5C1AGR2_9BACT|nr:hypothetical protein [Limnoglobus roseus]QEL18401.1 hypothetical protein PX52LOC_05425 [Limnoglobus roseus]
MAATQNPPPKTVPSKVSVRKIKTPALEIDVTAEVIADGTTNDTGTQGNTSFTPEGAVGSGQSFFGTPGFAFVTKNGQALITKINGPVQIKGNVKIQTVYGPNADATQTSGYGRGTTPDDEKAGNTTLGFHESCHRSDYLNYLRTKPFPTFTGRVGMTRVAYEKAVADFQKAIEKYFADMDKDSLQRTDEVGYKKSTYDVKGPRP